MQHRTAGNTDLTVSPLIIGTMARRGDHRNTRLDVYRTALEQGVTTFDTAPLYGFGRAERLLGEAMREEDRGTLQILGKVGLRWDAGDHGEILFEADDGDGGCRQVRRDSRPESVQQEVSRSLERLGTDYLDLVQIHQPDLHTPIGETMGALLDLQRSGKVRQIGVSNFSHEQIEAAQRALGTVPLCTVQAEYSLLQRDIERDMLPYCRSHNIGVLAYSPLAAGWLARRFGRSEIRGRLRNALRECLQPMAERYGTTTASLAIAWLLARPGLSGAISGVSSRAQLLEQIPGVELDVADTDLQELSKVFSGLARPDAQAASGGVVGRTLRFARRGAGALLRRAGIDPGALRWTGSRRRW